ncbi:reverse transcriptase domain-containing protein [Tanacetum coccineum]
MLLNFDDMIQDTNDEVTEVMKKKEKGKIITNDDLSKTFKEVLKCPFTRRIIEFSSPGHRMPTNAKVYDGTGDPEDHVSHFMGMGNQGEWPMPVWCRMFQQTLDGKARAWLAPKTQQKYQRLSGRQMKLSQHLKKDGTLHDVEQNYAPLEKIALALRHTSRRLRRYFEAHPITVITYQPIKQILSKEDTSGKLAQYSVELGAYNITYEPRSAIEGQILADFLNEVTVGSETMVPRCTPYTIDHQKYCEEEWVLYTDGASSIKGFGAGLVLIIPTKTEYTYALRLNFESTNNQAKYEALLAGLRIAKKIGVQSLSINVDSKLVASQINGNYEACKENMIRYLSKAKEYIKCFKNFKIRNISRNKKQKADLLSKLASIAFNHLIKEILVKTLDIPSMDIEEINAIVEEEGET